MQVIKHHLKKRLRNLNNLKGNVYSVHKVFKIKNPSFDFKFLRSYPYNNNMVLYVQCLKIYFNIFWIFDNYIYKLRKVLTLSLFRLESLVTNGILPVLCSVVRQILKNGLHWKNIKLSVHKQASPSPKGAKVFDECLSEKLTLSDNIEKLNCLNFRREKGCKCPNCF